MKKKCGLCNRRFSNGKALQQHKDDKHSPPDRTYIPEAIESQSNLSRPVVSQPTVSQPVVSQPAKRLGKRLNPKKFKPHTCDRCNSSFATDYRFQQHLAYSESHAEKLREAGLNPVPLSVALARAENKVRRDARGRGREKAITQAVAWIRSSTKKQRHPPTKKQCRPLHADNPTTTTTITPIIMPVAENSEWISYWIDGTYWIDETYLAWDKDEQDLTLCDEYCEWCGYCAQEAIVYRWQIWNKGLFITAKIAMIEMTSILYGYKILKHSAYLSSPSRKDKAPLPHYLIFREVLG